jgi:hypothetical protein
MNVLGDFFANNPNAFIGLFIGVLIIFLAGFIFIKMKNATKKNELREKMVELSFDATVRLASQFFTDLQFVGYKIYSVNGQEPTVVGQSIFVPTGTCKVELEYIDTDYFTRHISTTTLHGKQTLSLTTQKGERYKIKYDEKNSQFKIVKS